MMMKLFSEKVKPTFTSSNLNILTVEDFQEIFFDVFEFEINGKKFVAEKVSEYKDQPVIEVPLVLEGEERLAQFVLQRGVFEVIFNKDNPIIQNQYYEKSDNLIINYTDKNDEIEEIIFEKRNDILKEINLARQSAEKYVEQLKQQKIDEAKQYFDVKQKELNEEINNSKKSLLDEFLSLIEGVRSDFFESNEKEKEKLFSFVENSVSKLADELSYTIAQNQESAEEKFNSQINELATNILSGILLKEIDTNNKNCIKNINERFEAISSGIKNIISNEINQVEVDIFKKIEENNNAIVSLEKTSIELNDQINKGTNKALSRIGNVKTQLEESLVSAKEELTDLYNEKISTAEKRINAFYDGKIALVEEKVLDLTTENKQYFLNLINESKQSLLSEIANIKVDVPNIVIEKSNGKQEVDLKGIKSELEKIIGTRFSNELQALKRLIEMSSGGGSVAKQFANGGIMDGSLTVTGAISASQYLGLTLPSGNYLPLSGGTVNGDLNVNGGNYYINGIDLVSYITSSDEPPVIWWVSDLSSSDEGIPRSHNANALRIVASGNVTEGQPIPQNITITITADGIYGGPYTYSLQLNAGDIFNSVAIASALKVGLNNVIYLGPGSYETLVQSYNNIIALWHSSNNLDEILSYSLTCNYGTVNEPAYFNSITETIEYCNYFPDGLGQFVNSTRDGTGRQWICTNLNPIIWTEITQSSNLPAANTEAIASTLVQRDTNAGIRAKEFVLKNGTNQYGIKIKPDSFPTLNNINYIVPFVSGIGNAEFVLTQGAQTINGVKTFNANIVGNGTSNLFANEAGSSPHSLLTQQQLMRNGHKFRQNVCVNTKKVGALAATVAEPFQVLGMKVSIGNDLAQAAAAYTLDGLFCTDVSNTTLPINNEIDAYFHGVAMQFLPEATWKARINFGVPYAKAIPYANQLPASITPSVQQQWGVEFSHNGTNFVGRLYFLYDAPIRYGDYFNLPLYQGADFNGWGGFVYSIRMRQVVIAQNTLRLEFYMNESVSNNGGTQLSKTTPLSTLVTPTITIPNFRFDGKHINFEVASNTIAFGNPPTGQVRMQCTNMYCQFK